MLPFTFNWLFLVMVMTKWFNWTHSNSYTNVSPSACINWYT